MRKRIQHRGYQGTEHTKQRRSRGREGRMHYPWYKEKVPLQRITVEREVRWTWRQHMEDCRKVWQEGPKTQKLRQLW